MTVDVVLIGRNEGTRLITALDAVQGQARQVVYVDSGSTDDSIAQAQARGAKVVNLDMSVPFTAARARNAGFDALDAPEIVQFIDGDCALVPGWLETGQAFLNANPDVGMVTGWRSEIRPEDSLYNRLCDWEWHRPAGDILACGGDMMVRASLWRDVGGMNPTVIAAEDDEVCCRFRKAGWRLHRLPQAMTRHDAAMLTFGQWWARAERTGHGFAQVHHLHPDYFRTEVKRVLVYGLILPLVALAFALTVPLLILPILALYALSLFKGQKALLRDGIPPCDARKMALLLTLSKFPNMIGLARFHLRRLTGREMRIIEYK
ncbi:glycosyltransferase [Tropicibacter naphthalenivorans]|uniref:Mycofactocin system glycosyltransferase n=1 Tax=Tropicibacter naphthalenivorans TaxID=441103 RepID=A0A0P1GWI9_9RHOB|nr:glycosyltransferase [Tropicibacter naphthalenivorans]CUH79412.1 mycofactocin system glycosyltransferase [Tropicibacter naphthalenivorans]SMC72055.1 Glycosyltransferase like family 2 [Tropicibacter naphthalenivorans]